MEAASGDCDELAVRHISLPLTVPTPAFDCPVGTDSARMGTASGDCDELAV